MFKTCRAVALCVAMLNIGMFAALWVPAHAASFATFNAIADYRVSINVDPSDVNIIKFGDASIRPRGSGMISLFDDTATSNVNDPNPPFNENGEGLISIRGEARDPLGEIRATADSSIFFEIKTFGTDSTDVFITYDLLVRVDPALTLMPGFLGRANSTAQISLDIDVFGIGGFAVREQIFASNDPAFPDGDGRSSFLVFSLSRFQTLVVGVSAEARGSASIRPDPDPPVVPLPAAAWMFLTALGGLGLFGWRRRRATT